jgi:hypothetical protein
MTVILSDRRESKDLRLLFARFGCRLYQSMAFAPPQPGYLRYSRKPKGIMNNSRERGPLCPGAYPALIRRVSAPLLLNNRLLSSAYGHEMTVGPCPPLPQ